MTTNKKMVFSKKLLICITATIALTACGGGGGSEGSPGGGTNGVGTGTSGTGNGSTGTTPIAVPTLKLALVDSAGAATNSVSASSLVSAKATLKDAAGAAVVGAKVTFISEIALIKISPATSVLTDTAGVATVQVSAAFLSAAGAGTMNASAIVNGTTLATNIDYQLSPAKLTLASLDVGENLGILAAYGNRPVSVIANVNGAPTTSTPVQVTFTASCGTVKPSNAMTDGTGKAATTYTADSANCAGTNVKITTNSVGVSAPLEATIAVAAVQATNLQFVSASPALIYLLSSGAATQSLVTFKAIDSSGNPVQNQKVNLSLLNPAPAAGMSIDTLGNNVGVAKTTDAAGQVTVAVFSGNVPTSVQITAKIDTPSTIQTNSNTLTVASGKPVQKSASLSLETTSIEAFDFDSVTSMVTFSIADRQGNPAPDGTEVNFVAEAGVMIPARCVIAGGSSQCVSKYRSGGTRPLNGRVSIMAYVPGEEDFVDANFNNQYDLNEKFTDLGNAYRDDDDLDNAFTLGEFSVPRVGSVSCNINYGDYSGLPGENGRPATCDGVWGPNEVRKQTVIVLATSKAKITAISTKSTDFRVLVTDLNDNRLATGSKVAASKQSGSGICTVKTVLPATIANAYGTQTVSVDLDQCTAGIPPASADLINVTVTSPSGFVTNAVFPITP
ncbi:MAG: hypothetical protein JWR74_2503 [Polaromonas sp.]|nr:hypothetical protein [Polaromonas sp.]